MTPTQLLLPLRDRADRIAVTGGSGWFGRVALDLLDQALGPDAAERVVAYGSKSALLTTSAGRPVEVHPLTEMAPRLDRPTLVLHFAFLTRDKVAVLGQDAFLAQNLRITESVLAALATGHVSGLAVTSSGAASAQPTLTDEPYGFLKRLDELALGAAAREVGAPCVTARVFNVAGRWMTKAELYALGSFLHMAQAGRPIEIQATRPVVRGYVGVDEVVGLLVADLLDGVSTTWSTGGRPVELQVLAEVVARVCGRPGSIAPRALSAQAPDSYVGDEDGFKLLADRHGLQLRDLDSLVAMTGSWLSELDCVQPTNGDGPRPDHDPKAV